MNIPSWVFILIHMGMVTVSGVLLMFSNNVTVLGIMTVILLVVFCSCVYFDGCITTKAEDPLPYVNMKPTEVIKQALFVDNDITMSDMEKVLIGLTLAAYSVKTGILLVLRDVYGLSYSRFLAFLANQKTPYGTFIYHLLV